MPRGTFHPGSTNFAMRAKVTGLALAGATVNRVGAGEMSFVDAMSSRRTGREGRVSATRPPAQPSMPATKAVRARTLRTISS
jgi:hypothetical protein